MKTIIFAVAGYNLAETGRHIEIAKASKKFFNVVFLSYGGQFENLIEQEGFKLKRMEPRLTEKQLRRVRKALNGETMNTVGYFTAKEMQPRVENEIDFYKEIKPACVLTGWCQSVLISTRVAEIPLVNVLHSTSVTEYYKAGLQTIPDRRDFPFIHWLFSEEQINKWISNLVLKLKLPAKPFNILAKKYGLKEFNNFIELLEGDYTLLADIPEWVNLPEVRANLKHIGPLPLRLNGKIPKKIEDMPSDKPIVYFAMGSSGKPKIITDIISGFKDKPYHVIAPVESHIKNMNVNIPSNVVVTGFLPAHKVNPMADISVIHGGQNTVMNACLSGTPIVGVGMHAEQQANLDACVRKGFAIRLNKKRVTAEKVLKSIDKLLKDKTAKEKVIEFQSQLMKWDGPKNAAKFLYEKFSQ
ncbi:MAG: glycosyltransferase [Ignavibacteriaceae bacterium]|jgi:UDP:flavonoid glycosyltransferase YjiC (YdhE family)|nr:glycosyltransferase [Ignavibacteriaceae bacterium]